MRKSVEVTADDLSLAIGVLELLRHHQGIPDDLSRMIEAAHMR